MTIDGTTIAGLHTATASHAAGASQAFSFSGNWGAGPHTVGITFINDAWGGSTAADRNLYVDRVAYDGRTASGAPAALGQNGTANFTVPAADASTATTLMLRLAEDAWQGDAQFLVSIDGRAVKQPAMVTASNALGQSQTVSLQPALTRGTHDVSVTFLNDRHGGTSSTDRNLHVKGIDVNGQAAPGTTATLMSTGTAHFPILIT